MKLIFRALTAVVDAGILLCKIRREQKYRQGYYDDSCGLSNYRDRGYIEKGQVLR